MPALLPPDWATRQLRDQTLEIIGGVAWYGGNEASTEATPSHPRSAFAIGMLIDQRIDFVGEFIDFRNRNLEIMTQRGVRLS